MFKNYANTLADAQNLRLSKGQQALNSKARGSD
jgi:hypothetical protein